MSEQTLLDPTSREDHVSNGSSKGKRSRHHWRHGGLVALLVVFVLLLGAGTVGGSSLLVPTISIASVVPNENVQIQTHNFPKGQIFTVRMNYMGTLGVGGEVVGTFDSSRGDMAAAYAIPDFLKGQRQIAVRFDSNQGYYSYNWFWNDTAGSGGQPTPPDYSGVPLISVAGVDPGRSVTITTYNFPPNQVFDVTQGLMYTAGINGIKVGEIQSGDGSSQTVTFSVPAELANQAQISIRAQTRQADPYYAYNWFWNSTDSGSGGQPPVTPVPPVTATPSFKICTVTRDQQIVIQTANYPANMNFTVTMGSMYTQGIGGAVSATFNSGTGGSVRQILPIPDAVKGLDQISVRAQGSPYYSYNWFWNNTTTVDYCN